VGGGPCITYRQKEALSSKKGGSLEKHLASSDESAVIPLGNVVFTAGQGFNQPYYYEQEREAAKNNDSACDNPRLQVPVPENAKTGGGPEKSRTCTSAKLGNHGTSGDLA